MSQINPPFSPGDRVMYSDSFGLVLKCEAKRFGWLVNVMPEGYRPPFWIDSQQLILARKDNA